MMECDTFYIRDKTKDVMLKNSVRTGMVQYDDHDFTIASAEMLYNFNAFALELCFHKCKKFSVQNEFRISIVNSSDSAREDIVIGSLSSDEYERYDIQSVNDPMDITF